MFVTERFILDDSTIDTIRSMTPEFGFGGFGEFIFYRTYSRIKDDGFNENWADVVIRVVEGVFSIRKNHYVKNYINWDEDFWQHYARNFAMYLFDMKWLPPGRGLWAMGSDFVYERGSMALQNCGFIELDTENLSDNIYWLMDSMMCGVGVGFYPSRQDVNIVHTARKAPFTVPDSREGWCESVKILIEHYTDGEPKPIFNYSGIRDYGDPIKGFGGTSSGPEPLIDLHKKIDNYFQMYMDNEWYDSVILKMDLANAVGCCVVSGNVRRGAELAALPIDDPVFMDMKDYDKYPHRSDIGWMSNNSVILDDNEDFEKLDGIAKRVIKNGEPGFINRKNFKYGRIGKCDNVKNDLAIATNPCGEQPLESFELCTLAETLPTRCDNFKEWRKAVEYATMYASTVTLLPTHSPKSNSVMIRNRRIGVSIVDVSGWKIKVGTNKLVKYLREGYQIVRSINKWANSEAGIPEAIRVTTIKPGGTVPKIAGRTSGIGHPNFHYTLRRVNVARGTKVYELLVDAGVPHEPSVYTDNTEVFEFPIIQGPAKPADQVSLWEQAMNIVMMQREWSDNAVSNTLTFKPSEIDDIESVLSMIAPLVKSISLLPQTDEGVYPQTPESALTKDDYEERISKIKPIKWDALSGLIAEPELYCTGDKCESDSIIS